MEQATVTPKSPVQPAPIADVVVPLKITHSAIHADPSEKLVVKPKKEIVEPNKGTAKAKPEPNNTVPVVAILVACVAFVLLSALAYFAYQNTQ